MSTGSSAWKRVFEMLYDADISAVKFCDFVTFLTGTYWFSLLQSCVMDTLSPVKVKVNFSQAESQQPHGIINVDSKREAVVEVGLYY